MALPYISPSERSYILSGLSDPTQPTRSDGRSLHQFRSIELSYGDAPQAYGSARIVVGGRGGTEVVVGVKLEVVDGFEGEEVGREGWRGSVEVDVTPQAYPHLNASGLTALSSYYANLIADHFIPYLPPIPILPPYKYFQPQIHITLTSSSSGSVPSTIFQTVRSAFSTLLVPRTKSVGWEAVAGGSSSTGDEVAGAGLTGTDAGLSGAVRAGLGQGKAKKGGRIPRNGQRKGGKDDEWDLDHSLGDSDGGVLLDESVREGLPVCVTLNLIPNSSTTYLDASAQEELASSSRIHMFYCGPSNDGRLKVCGMRIEGGEGVEVGRVRGLMKEGESIAKELMKDLNAHASSSQT